MLTKILFTLLVIVGVSFFFRTKNQQKREIPPPATPPKQIGLTSSASQGKGKSLSTRVLAYILIGVLAAVSVLIYVVHSNSENQIVNIRVISDGGEVTNYQARHKTIKGRKFETLDGKLVTLGESDRIEMIEQ